MALPTPPSISARTAARLRDGGAATVNELSRELELSRSSVENAVTLLSGLGLVVEGAVKNGRGAGRPARRHRFAESAGTVVGVDVGGASVRVVVADLAGTVLVQRDYRGIADAPGAARKLAAVVSDIRRTVDEAGGTVSAVRAVGVSLPAIVDGDGHVIASVIIPEWSGVEVGIHLERALNCPIAVDNGVRNAAVAEYHLGAAQLIDDFVYLSVGHRIALGLVLGGQARRGVHNIAGDIGRLAFRGFDAETGQIAWTSANSAEEVFGMAARGEDAARAEIAGFVEEVARGIAMVAMTVDPALVVIGGGLSRAHEQFIGPLREAVGRHIRLPVQIPVVEARLGADAGAYGALVHAFQRFSERIYGLAGLPVPRVRSLETGE